MKDPAFLFYSSDFLLGSAFLTMEECGQYIKALCWLHQNNGRLPKDKLELAVGKMSDQLLSKFNVDEEGMLFNQRLLDEIHKRKKWTSSRRSNLSNTHMDTHMDAHMENENVNVNINRFIKPTIEEIKKYCEERKNSIDAEAFFHHYESCGWKIANKPMKNWKSAVITWEKRNACYSNSKQVSTISKQNNFVPFIEKKLGKIATDEMIIDVLCCIPENMWWQVDKFLKDRYKGSKGIAHCESTIKRNKEILANLSSSLSKGE